jgi:hypothetical protein
LTLTDTEAVPVVPSVPTQLSENVVVALKAPELMLPEIPGSVPFQALEAGFADALQVLVPTEFQVSATAVPPVTLLADAVNVSVGAGGVGAICKPYRP